MDKAQEDMTNLLYTIPNVPYDSVPEGVSAVSYTHLQRCTGIGARNRQPTGTSAPAQCSHQTDEAVRIWPGI